MSAQSPSGPAPAASAGAAGLASVGLGVAPAPRDLPSHLLPDGVPPRTARPGASRAGAGLRRLTQPGLVAEARFALVLLGGALAGVYLIAGGQLIGGPTLTAILALGIGLLQVAWTAGVLAGAFGALVVGAAANLLLVGVWIVSRTSGLADSGPQPIGVLDVFCAVDSVAIALLAGGLVLAPARIARARISPLLVHLPILLAAASLSALAGGHTHSGAGGPRAAGSGTVPNAPHFYCRLL